MADLVFDWDGAVFPCCSDFERLHPIGNLADSTLDEVLTSAERRAFESRLAQGQWDQLPTCSKCKWDSPGAYRATLL
jgi:radical SAM protein with 4Fe4S-binding SPASM domain